MNDWLESLPLLPYFPRPHRQAWLREARARMSALPPDRVADLVVELNRLGIDATELASEALATVAGGGARARLLCLLSRSLPPGNASFVLHEALECACARHAGWAALAETYRTIGDLFRAPDTTERILAFLDDALPHADGLYGALRVERMRMLLRRGHDWDRSVQREYTLATAWAGLHRDPEIIGTASEIRAGWMERGRPRHEALPWLSRAFLLEMAAGRSRSTNALEHRIRRAAGKRAPRGAVRVTDAPGFTDLPSQNLEFARVEGAGGRPLWIATRPLSIGLFQRLSPPSFLHASMLCEESMLRASAAHPFVLRAPVQPVRWEMVLMFVSAKTATPLEIPLLDDLRGLASRRARACPCEPAVSEAALFPGPLGRHPASDLRLAGGARIEDFAGPLRQVARASDGGLVAYRGGSEAPPLKSLPAGALVGLRPVHRGVDRVG